MYNRFVPPIPFYNQLRNPLMPAYNQQGASMLSPQQAAPKINPEQFKQYVPYINDNMLQQIAIQAKNQGISDQQIAEGMQFIQSLR